jgi:hypothetical protein
MTTPCGFAIELPLPPPLSAATDTLRAALAADQTGSVSEVDVQARLEAKLGLDSQPQRLLGTALVRVTAW